MALPFWRWGLVFKFVLKDNTNYRLCAFLGYLALVSGVMGSGYLDDLGFAGIVAFLVITGIGFIVMSAVFAIHERRDLNKKSDNTIVSEDHPEA